MLYLPKGRGIRAVVGIAEGVSHISTFDTSIEERSGDGARYHRGGSN